MPNNMPVRVLTPIIVGEPTRRELQAVAARREMENGLLVHTLRAHFDKECSKLDAEAAFEASKFALDTELELLAWGIAEANGSAAASKLVADRIEQLSRINSRNLSERFGS